MCPSRFLLRRNTLASLVALLLSAAAHGQVLPDLHVLSVGIDRYRPPAASLSGCVNDATGMTTVLRSQEGKRFGKVVATVLTDEQATADAVLAALEALPKKGKAGDWIAIILSGHGGLTRNAWHFQAQDNRSVSESALLEAADRCASQGKIAWILIDACQAGQLRHVGAPLLNRHRDPEKGGVILMVSSTSEQFSNALGRYSAFARAVEEGLKGEADYDGDAVVSLRELRRYSFNRVYELLLQNRVYPGLTVADQDSAIDASLSLPDQLPLTHAGKSNAVPAREAPKSHRPDLAERTWKIATPGSATTPPTAYELRLDPFGYYVASLKQGLKFVRVAAGRYAFRGDSLILTHAQGSDPLEIINVSPTQFHFRFQGKEMKATLDDSSPSERIVDESGIIHEGDPRDRFRKDSPHKVHVVSLEAGTSYVIDLMSPDFDAFVRLEDESGAALAENDDGGAGTDARLAYAPVRTGQYRVIVTTFRGGGGHYHLHVGKRAPWNAGPRSVPVLVLQESFELRASDPPDRLNPRFPAQEHRIELKAGATYSIDMTSKDFDAWLRLEDDEGHRLAEDDDSGGNLNARLLFTPTRSGTYRLIATTYQQGLGRYTLAVRAFPQDTAPSNDEIVVLKGVPFSSEDRFAPADPADALKRTQLRKTYVLNLPSGRSYVVNVESKDFSPVVRIEDAAGRLVAFGDGAFSGRRVSLTFAAGSELRGRIVVLPGQEAAVGAFRITITESP